MGALVLANGDSEGVIDSEGTVDGLFVTLWTGEILGNEGN